MSEIPGQTCDVILKHASHEDLPLILYRTPADPIGPRVKIHYEVYWPEDASQATADEPIKVRHLFFTALAADEILCPDGGWYQLSPDEVRKRFNAITRETTDIMLQTQAGTIMGLYCDEHAVIDTIYQDAHTLEVHLTTRNLWDYPATPETVENIWLRDDAGAAASNWGAAKWQ